MQSTKGQFAHEYPNPFASATALRALRAAAKAGVATPEDAFARGAAAIDGTRAANGRFSYSFGRQRGSPSAEMAGGRMPLCELALLLCGRSDQQRLAAAIEESLDRHAALEQVRAAKKSFK